MKPTRIEHVHFPELADGHRYMVHFENTRFPVWVSTHELLNPGAFARAVRCQLDAVFDPGSTSEWRAVVSQLAPDIRKVSVAGGQRWEAVARALVPLAKLLPAAVLMTLSLETLDKRGINPWEEET
jgi:hypothetical protein